MFYYFVRSYLKNMNDTGDSIPFLPTHALHLEAVGENP